MWVMHLARFPPHSLHAAAVGACSWPGTEGLLPAVSMAPFAGGVLPIAPEGSFLMPFIEDAKKAGTVRALSLRRWGMNLLHWCRSQGAPHGTSLNLTLSYVTDGAAASLQGLSPFSSSQEILLDSILYDRIAFLCCNVFRVVENVGCFCNLFMNRLQGLLCALYWVVLEVWRVSFCLGTVK